MSVDLLIIAHNKIGQQLVATAASMIGNLSHYFGADLNVEFVSGVNLPMLPRVLNYNGQPLDQMAATAVEGAKRGIVRGQ
jgi:hypothetical protein